MITAGEFVILDRHIKITNKFQKTLNKTQHELSCAYFQKQELMGYIADLESLVSDLHSKNKVLSDTLRTMEIEQSESELIIAELQKRLTH